MSTIASVTDLEFDPQLGTTPTAMSVNNFVRADDSDIPDVTLVLRPPFQRNLVWNETQQAFLIDSILRGLPVPELYIQVKISEAGDEQVIVVDGQQRISSCLAFVKGQFTLGDTPEFDERWRGRSFGGLTPELRSRVREYEFIVRKLPASASDLVLREIFRRLNRTVEVLQPQELRHAAFTGPFIGLVESAASAAFLRDLGVFTPVDYRRRRSDEFIAEVLMAVQAGAFPNKKDGLDDLFLAFERQGLPDAVRENLEGRFGRVARLMDSIASELKKTRFRNKSDAYSLLVYLAGNAERLELNENQTATFVARARDFSELVNSVKRLEANQASTDDLTKSEFGPEALVYLRAVERAASDRLSRVRRGECLQKVFSSIFNAAEPTELTEHDRVWTLAVDEEPEENSPSSEQTLSETHGVQKSLLSGSE